MLTCTQDLSYLNRPVGKTILLDTKAGHAKAQPDNAIILKPWSGDPDDRELLKLIPFLEYVAVMGIEDVRKAIKSFEGADVATEFAAREARMRAKYAEELAASKSSRHGGGSKLKSLADRVVRGGAGGAGQEQMSLVEAMAEGKTVFDVMRDEGMKRYKLMEKEIKENGDKWLKEEAELIKRMEEEQMKNMKTNPLSMFGFGGPQSQIDPQKVMEQMQKERELQAQKEKEKETK
jgi:import inner membrane translocase subunit TIM50